MKNLKKTFISENKRTDTLIRIGKPVTPTTSLSPSISEIKVIRKKDIKAGEFQIQSERNEDELNKYKPDTPINIKIKGKNFPMFYKFSYSQIDSKFCFCHSTAISKDTQGNTIWESIIHIPQPLEFEKLATHSISYSTPFGTVIKGF